MIRIRCLGYQKPGSIHNEALQAFGRDLSAELPDAVEVDVVEDATTLGYRQFDRPGLVASGEFSIWYQSTSYFTEIGVPGFGILDLPYIFSARNHALRAMDGPPGHILRQAVDAHTPFTVLGFWDNGFRHISNSLRPIREPGDCDGMRMRTLTSPLHGEAFRRLGMTPEIMDIATLIERAQAGTIDAQDNSLANIQNFGIHRVHRHVSLTRHIWGSAAFLVNREQFGAWSPRVQDAVLIAAARATALQRRLAEEADVDLLRVLRKDGVAVEPLGCEQRRAFAHRMAPVAARYLPTVPTLRDTIADLA